MTPDARMALLAVKCVLEQMPRELAIHQLDYEARLFTDPFAAVKGGRKRLLRVLANHPADTDMVNASVLLDDLDISFALRPPRLRCAICQTPIETGQQASPDPWRHVACEEAP